ncbi:MAG TPA: NAD-dependent epimerase/dehydratase family protein [Vicinamibacteria bacterium]
MARIALTGIASALGGRLLRRLVEARGGDAVLAVDITAPPATLAVRHRELDLTEPAADQRLLDVFREEQVDTVVHLALFTSPRRDASYAHELESIGTLGVLAAAAAAGVRHVVLRSFTAVYGARGQNPMFLSEDRPLPAGSGLGWVRDKLEAEQHAASFARRFPSLGVTVLRYAPLFGPGVHNFYTRLFDHRLVPVVMGYDPLVQLLHPDDALAATEAALERAPRGAFNVVPRLPIALLTALHLAGKVPLPVPHPLAHAGADLLWSAGLSEAPGGFVDFARFTFMGDGEKARRELGFEARYSSQEALQDYQGYRHPAAGSRQAAEAAEAAP